MTQVQHADIEVKPSRNYQSVSFSFRLVFDTPLSLEEAKFEADVAYAELKELAEKRLAELAAAAPATTPSVSAPTQSAGANWAVANKPNGTGSFRYIPTSVISRADFISMSESKLADAGIDASDVTIFDDRGGDRGIEAGGGHYSAGKVKAKPDGKLIQAMGGKAIVANIDFTPDGDVKISVTREGKTAISALAIAGQLNSPTVPAGSTPF